MPPSLSFSLSHFTLFPLTLLPLLLFVAQRRFVNLSIPLSSLQTALFFPYPLYLPPRTAALRLKYIPMYLHPRRPLRAPLAAAAAVVRFRSSSFSSSTTATRESASIMRVYTSAHIRTAAERALSTLARSSARVHKTSSTQRRAAVTPPPSLLPVDRAQQIVEKERRGQTAAVKTEGERARITRQRSETEIEREGRGKRERDEITGDANYPRRGKVVYSSMRRACYARLQARERVQCVSTRESFAKECVTMIIFPR